MIVLEVAINMVWTSVNVGYDAPIALDFTGIEKDKIVVSFALVAFVTINGTSPTNVAYGMRLVEDVIQHVWAAVSFILILVKPPFGRSSFIDAVYVPFRVATQENKDDLFQEVEDAVGTAGRRNAVEGLRI